MVITGAKWSLIVGIFLCVIVLSQIHNKKVESSLISDVKSVSVELKHPVNDIESAEAIPPGESEERIKNQHPQR